MRSIRQAVLLTVLALANTGVLASCAYAVLPEFLDNVKGNTFTGSSGASEIVDVANGFAVKCKADKVAGEVTGEKTIKATLDLEGCTETGLSVHSLGDAGGVILTEVSGELCFLKEGAPLEVGVFFKLPAGGLHAEDPSIGALELFTGSFIGKAENINILQALQDVSFKKVNPTKCGGKEAKLLLEFEHDGKPLVNEVVSFEELHFAKDIEIMG
jgi:hypothetical protein